jgi:iron complex outermembrane receptor protein
MCLRAWLALVLVAAPCHGAAAQAPARLTVDVRDPAGMPLAGAAVRLASGTSTRDARTGRDGRVTFDDVPPGAYRIRAAFTGLAPAIRAADLRPGEAVTVTLTLRIEAADETTVTADRTGERAVRATPMAITALSARDLQRVQAHTIEQIAGLAPGLTFSQNTGFAQLTIRGIGTNGVVYAGSDPSNALYVDGVYLARPAMVLGDFVDLDRVEVLRGPQGTLYGRNAVGGAVNVVTRMPTNDVEASARVDLGTAGLWRGEARVSGPLVRDRVLGSAAFVRGARDGFVRDLSHPGSPLGGEDVTAGRGKLHVVFNRSVDLLVAGDASWRDPTPLVYAKVLAVKPGFEGRVDNPPDLHEVRTSVAASSENLQHGESARLTVQLAPGTTITSLTAFRKLDYQLFVDGDITELELTTSDVHEIQHQVTEELTISHQAPRLSWIGGAFLLGEDDRQPVYVGLGGANLYNHLEPHVNARSRAVFAQATLPITPRASITAGLRYTNEEKTIANMGERFTLDLPRVRLPTGAYAYTDAIAHDAWTPKLAFEVHPSASALVYASAARGFKSGGFNLSSTAPGRGYAPEWAWSYEGGVKTALAQGRATLALALFHTDYKDLQVQTAILPGVIDISNAAEATIRGAELEGTVRVTPRALDAGGHLAWLDARYDRYVAVGVGGVTGDAAGHRLNNAPEWSGRLWIEGRRQLGRGTLSLRADGRWQSTVFYTPFNDAIQRQRLYGLLDLSASLDTARWSIGAYARNATDTGYITGAFSSPPPAIGGRPGDSRQIGVQFTVRRQ